MFNFVNCPCVFLPVPPPTDVCARRYGTHAISYGPWNRIGIFFFSFCPFDFRPCRPADFKLKISDTRPEIIVSTTLTPVPVTRYTRKQSNLTHVQQFSTTPFNDGRGRRFFSRLISKGRIVYHVVSGDEIRRVCSEFTDNSIVPCTERRHYRVSRRAFASVRLWYVRNLRDGVGQR